MRAPASPLLERHRPRAAEFAYWLLAIAVYFVFPRNLALATSIFVMALFALSLDLVLGFTGIVSFGHAVFFGIGAYSAGLLALAGYVEPVTGAILAGLIATAFAVLTGPLVLRVGGLPQIMVTLAIGVIMFEFANKAVSITRGDDGLGGIVLMPLFGFFRWTAFGQTAFWYALGWLFALFVLVRAVIASPFGVALQGVRENSQRMRFIGSPVLKQSIQVYAMSGFVAGIAGAVSCQTNKFAGLDTLSTDRSIDGLVMLILGGVGRLYGGLIGAPVYMLVRSIASEWNPFHWLFVVGGLLIFVVMFARGGILGLAEAAGRVFRAERHP
jgi:branched-chain amino acid transport system permease protein